MSAGPARLVVFALLTGGAVLVWAMLPTYPSYDSYYSLDWGRELLHGIAPSFTVYQAPTHHPLFVAISAMLAGSAPTPTACSSRS